MMDQSKNSIAVIGIACRFPGAKNLGEFWDNLISGKETISHFTDEELSKNEFEFDLLRNNPDYVKAKGILDDIDKFDAAFFGMTPREAATTDPQQRVWLETAWDAFENAGCDPFNYKGAIGVFAGGSRGNYILNNILRDPKTLEKYIRFRLTESFQLSSGNDISFIATKTAYKFNLKGPAINVQTACSTSLVAIVQACQSLYSFESDLCLAGGVTINVPQETGYIYKEGGISSPDGHCRPFDANAKGTVTGHGVGVVVLKRLEDALRDKDTIYATVLGWALNNDGSNKVSYAAPSIEGQAEVIRLAQSFAEISPEDVGYIEAHGTATPLGDPIEIAALTKAFSAKTDKKQFCGVGSVKSNIGHTDSAAGVAGFIKACLAARFKRIPPSLNFASPNPHIDFENSPFYVQKDLKEWTDKRPLIIGVSSFGIGGTNAHVVIEEPPSMGKVPYTRPEWPELLVLSAKNGDSLTKRKEDFIEFLKSEPDVNIHDVAYTLRNGRNHMSLRSFLVASNTSEIIETGTFIDGKKDDLISRIAFMFPGQGAQYVTMGRELYYSIKQFRQILDYCFNIVLSDTGTDLKTILFESENLEHAENQLASTDLTQPSLFIVEYALAKLLEDLKIRPDFLIGHSIGEYTAACIAGVFDLESSLKIVIKRGTLMKKMPSGKMMAVRTSYDKLINLKGQDFEIAANNSPNSCSISFRPENTDKVRKIMDSNGIAYIALNTSHAFHSSSFDSILSEFGEYVEQFAMKAPEIPFISCVTGKFITTEQATSGLYWAQQLRKTVHFSEGISLIGENNDVLFLEVGPNTHLSTQVRENSKIINKKAIINTLGKADGVHETYKIIGAIGSMFNTGIEIDLSILQDNNAYNKIALPGYPFKKIRHWIDFKYPEGSDSLLEYASTSAMTETKSTEITQGEGNTITESYYIDTNTSILNIWKSQIGIDDIGPDDNFFEIGGHSLIALQILTRIKEDLHLNIPLKTFIDNPTVNRLCSIISTSDATWNAVDLVHLTDTINLPLTRNQKRLWLISKLQPDELLYIISITYKLNGSFSREIFEKSLNILFQRHNIVFSRIKEVDSEPYCDIVPVEVSVPFFDYTGLSENEKLLSLKDLFISDSRKAFDLEKGPLYRLYLIQTAPDEFYFRMSIHHIIFDGWSFGVLVNDLSSIYNSLAAGKEPDLEKLEFQQYDYAHWETNNLDIKKGSIAFWEENLKGCSPVLNFPFDFPRKEESTGRGSFETIRLTKQLSDSLRAISRGTGSSLFSTLMSGFGILLHKYSGEDDLNIGMPVAYRPHTQLEKVFGMFVNTVVVRLRYEKGSTFRELIRQTNEAAMNAIEFQDLPFENVVELVRPERIPGINPLFQVALAWQNNLNVPLKLEGIRSEKVHGKERAPTFDITLYLWEKEDTIQGEIEYSADLLKQDTIIRLRDHFLDLLAKLADNPDSAVESLPMISDADKTLINTSNNTRTEYPGNMTVARLFEEQADLFRDKTALVFKDDSLTYEELNGKANQLARTLRAAGVTNNSPVGIMADKSLEMIVGILAILKAGGGYVPVDPEYPLQRIHYILEDSGCKTLLLQDKYNSLSPDNVHKINLNSPEAFSNSKSNIENINTSSDLAYIMYTSGTTGKPKGSMILQYSVLRLVRNTNYISLTPRDRILLTGAMVFDATTFEIWGALLNGATLYIVDKETILDPDALGAELDKNDISILWLTSALFTQIAEVRTDIFRKLNYLLTGGDVLSAPHINKVRKANPGLKILNCYGPTENTTFSTTYLIDKDFDHNIPIGKPIANSTAHIFDRNMNLLPVGVIGELYVGGDGLSAGYLNSEELNRTRFMNNPLNPGEKLYRTGDLARWLPDGNIEFHGRIDNQLKIRGFRVELEEIEAVISEIDGVIETVVKPVKVAEGDFRLVAFLNVPESFNTETSQISSLIKTRLPAYMIPSAFRILNGFPKTINGKTDKKALSFDISEFETKPLQQKDTFTKTEKRLHAIWCETLKTEAISLTDDFFNTGGNSLSGIRLINKIRESFGVKLTFRELVANSTISLLGTLIDTRTGGSEKAIDLIHLPESGNLPLTRNQKRLWIIWKLQPDVPSYIIPATFRFSGPLNREILRKSIDLLFRRHHIMFSVIKEDNGEPFCELLIRDAEVQFHDYTGLPADQKEKLLHDLVNSDSIKPFDLEKGPLYRLFLIKTAEDEHYFHMTIHHIIFDGWSWGILVNDLSSIYNSLAAGKEPDLEKLEFQQYDYAHWEACLGRKQRFG